MEDPGAVLRSRSQKELASIDGPALYHLLDFEKSEARLNFPNCFLKSVNFVSDTNFSVETRLPPIQPQTAEALGCLLCTSWDLMLHLQPSVIVFILKKRLAPGRFH